jgi:hypothetical protein
MPEDERRSILTEREKEILAGEADVTEKYYYVVVTRVRKKIEGVEKDLRFLEQNHNTLADELRDIVCDDE